MTNNSFMVCTAIVCYMQNFGMCQFDACQLFTDTLHPYTKQRNSLYILMSLKVNLGIF